VRANGVSGKEVLGLEEVAPAAQEGDEVVPGLRLHQLHTEKKDVKTTINRLNKDFLAYHKDEETKYPQGRGKHGRGYFGGEAAVPAIVPLVPRSARATNNLRNCVEIHAIDRTEHVIKIAHSSYNFDILLCAEQVCFSGGDFSEFDEIEQTQQSCDHD
jgi:hypothetical protein